MDALSDNDLALMKFGVGQAVPRKEDPTLLRGAGRYTDDINLPGQAFAVMVRSKIAHGVLKGIDIQAARAMPGVLAVLTHADLDAAGFGPLKCEMNIPDRDGKPMKTPPRPSLAKGKVRYVGEAVACVVAETAVQAKDAAEAVELDIEELPAVTSPAEALAAGAPQIHDDAPGNLVLDFHYGNAEAVKKAFAAAAHVTRLEINSNRIVVNPMEPRSAIGSYENDRWVLRLGCQGVMGIRGGLARNVLNTTPDKVRVLTGNVGGSFGMKGSPKGRPARAVSIGDGYVGLNINPRRAGRPGRLDHFGIQLDDLQATVARIREHYPEIEVLKRQLLLLKIPKGGSWVEVALITLKTAAGLAALAAAAQGWALRRTTPVERVLLVLAGLLLVFPSLLEALMEAIIGRDISYTATFGLAIGLLVLVKQRMTKPA